MDIPSEWSKGCKLVQFGEIDSMNSFHYFVAWWIIHELSINSGTQKEKEINEKRKRYIGKLNKKQEEFEIGRRSFRNVKKNR